MASDLLKRYLYSTKNLLINNFHFLNSTKHGNNPTLDLISYYLVPLFSLRPTFSKPSYTMHVVLSSSHLRQMGNSSSGVISPYDNGSVRQSFNVFLWIPVRVAAMEY